MEMISRPFLFLCVLQCLFFSFVASQPPLAPALYIFGDSSVDGGNNNERKTLAKADYPPYGIDFPIGFTGRFSNGLTMTDYFDLWLGLLVQITFMNTEESLLNISVNGLNYASASAGILPETGRATGLNLSMRKQVRLFRQCIRKYIPTNYKSTEKLSRYLSKSIFAVIIGSNDYLNNYLQPQHYNSSRVYNAEEFAELLARELGNHLKALYNLGARKFVVFEIGPLGCLPAIVNTIKPETRCAEDINGLVTIYNNKLAVKLSELSSTLKGSTFITANTYKLSYSMVHNPSQYGFTETRIPCCVVVGNGTGPCVPDTLPCEERNSFLFWDSFHPSEATNKFIASKCFNGTGLCSPMNILQLTQK